MSQSKAVERVLASGYLIDAKAYDLITKLPSDLDAESLADRLVEQKAGATGSDRVITERDVLNALPSGPPPDEPKQVTAVDASDVEVISDPTQAIAPIEAYEGFSRLFRDRYSRLSSILKGRLDAKGTMSVSSAKSIAPGKKAKVAGLVSSRMSRRNVVEVTIDDQSGSLKASCRDEAVSRAAMEAPLDSMVVMEVSRSKAGQLYIESLALPDVPGRRPTVSSHRVYAVLMSDLHVGSKMFLRDDFMRLLKWLNGEFGEADIVSRVGYLVIAGDLVDGVGVYPGQELQLIEKDPRRQYDSVAELLRQVPSRIQIVVSPGNHDPVRQALPQPAVSPDVAESLYSMENLRWVGDPSYVKLHGVTFLIYHGKSLDDVIAMTPGLSYHRPTDAMKLLLRARHLAPTYGKRTALSPELRDFLVIDPVPDVMHCGHVHTYGEMNYRGTLIVNSGTWQAQTSFQSNMGLEPTPSVVPIVDLSTLEAVRRNFGSGGFPLS